MARSSAASRVRWAVRMEKVLEMLNVATSSAMPAKASRKLRSVSRNVLLTELMLSLVSWAPVMACTPGGRTGWMRLTSSSWDTPGAALTEMLLIWSGRPVMERSAPARLNAV